jgi:O-antigen/teichoic acid export membrane protein
MGSRPVTGQEVDNGAGRPPAASLMPSAGIVFGGNLVARALGLLFPLLVAHATSRTDFALIYFFISTGFFVGELVLTGYPTAVTRQVAVATGRSGGRWLVAGIVAGVPLLFVSAVIGEILAIAAAAPPLLTTVVVCGLTLDAYYFAAVRGMQRFRLLMAYRILANLAQILLLGLAVVAGVASVPLVVAVYAGVYLVPMIAIEARWRPVVSLMRDAGSWSWEEVRVLTRFALPALVSGVAYGALLGLDVFFVRLFAATDLADYGAARTLAMPALMVPFAITIVLLPRAARASSDARLQLLIRAQLVALGVGIVLVGGYFVAGPWLIVTLLPREYAGAIEPLRSLTPALLILGSYSILSQWWFARNRPVTPAITLAIGAAVALLGHVTATSSMGATGAGVAIGGGAGAALVLLAVATWRSHE